MIEFEAEIRVRYSETDQMGYVYYGNYPQYFEIARTEMMRKYDLTYKNIEEMGIMMPVVSLNIQYKRPAKYDDLLHVKVWVEKIPTTRMEFSYEVYNQENKLLATGDTILVFVSEKTRRPVSMPDDFTKKIEKLFEK